MQRVRLLARSADAGNCAPRPVLGSPPAPTGPGRPRRGGRGREPGEEAGEEAGEEGKRRQTVGAPALRRRSRLSDSRRLPPVSRLRTVTRPGLATHPPPDVIKGDPGARSLPSPVCAGRVGACRARRAARPRPAPAPPPRRGARTRAR